jgi:hypothetical protein
LYQIFQFFLSVNLTSFRSLEYIRNGVYKHIFLKLPAPGHVISSPFACIYRLACLAGFFSDSGGTELFKRFLIHRHYLYIAKNSSTQVVIQYPLITITSKAALRFLYRAPPQNPSIFCSTCSYRITLSLKR